MTVMDGKTGPGGSCSEYLNRKLKNVPAWELIEMKVASLGQGKAEVRLEVKGKHMNPKGFCHGGIIATLADTAMGVALFSTGAVGSTVEMNINYMVPVNSGQVLIARGEVLRRGKTTAVIRADLFVGDTMVAASRGTYYILENNNREQGMD